MELPVVQSVFIQIELGIADVLAPARVLCTIGSCAQADQV
jgi:hypothetical protein